MIAPLPPGRVVCFTTLYATPSMAVDPRRRGPQTAAIIARACDGDADVSPAGDRTYRNAAVFLRRSGAWGIYSTDGRTGLHGHCRRLSDAVLLAKPIKR